MISHIMMYTFLKQEKRTMSGLYMDSQAPYNDSEAVPETTKSFASSLHKGRTFDQTTCYIYNS